MTAKVIEPHHDGHQCDLPRMRGGYGSTGYADYSVTQCAECGQWWYSAPCYEHFGPTSTWEKVRWFMFRLRRLAVSGVVL